MNRRNFLQFLAGLPMIGRFVAPAKPTSYREAVMVETPSIYIPFNDKPTIDFGKDEYSVGYVIHRNLDGTVRFEPIEVSVLDRPSGEFRIISVLK